MSPPQCRKFAWARGVSRVALKVHTYLKYKVYIGVLGACELAEYRVHRGETTRESGGNLLARFAFDGRSAR